MIKKTQTMDLQSFMQGRVVTKKSKELNEVLFSGIALGSVMTMLDMDKGFADTFSIPATSTMSNAFSGDTSWADYLIPMIQDQGLPLAVLMGTWACLEMIIRRPASAIDRLKWAVLGYLALQFVPTFIRHIGAVHHEG